MNDHRGERAGGHPGHSGGHSGGDSDSCDHPDSGKYAGFRRAYESGAPWDIGRPQPAYVELEEAGAIGARVLDVGCGTGELSLYLASRGHEVVGVDAVELAIAEARRKAAERELPVRFEVADVLCAPERGFPDLGAPFDTVVDVGFFHSLSDTDRGRLLGALDRLLESDGTYRFLCFSDRVPGTWGPRRVSEREIRETFAAPGWRVLDIAESTLATAIESRPEVPAWLAAVQRTG